MTNAEVLRRVGQERGIMSQAKSRKLKYFGYVSRQDDLEKDIILGMLPGKDDKG